MDATAKICFACGGREGVWSQVPVGSLLFAVWRARGVAHLWRMQLLLEQLGIRSSTTSAAA